MTTQPAVDDAQFLAARFFSPDERAILAEVMAIPRKGLCISRRTGIPKGRLYNLISNLRRRGVLRISDDGYEIADDRLKELIGQK